MPCTFDLTGSVPVLVAADHAVFAGGVTDAPAGPVSDHACGDPDSVATSLFSAPVAVPRYTLTELVPGGLTQARSACPFSATVQVASPEAADSPHAPTAVTFQNCAPAANVPPPATGAAVKPVGAVPCL